MRKKNHQNQDQILLIHQLIESNQANQQQSNPSMIDYYQKSITKI